MFQGLLHRQERNGLQETFTEFQIENQTCARKKEQLVFNLVTANKMKQSQTVYTWLTIIQLWRNKDKQQNVTKTFTEINKILADRLAINKPVYRSLSKISTNYFFNVK